MKVLESLKQSFLDWSNRQKEYNKVYKDAYDESYKQQLVVKAHQDARNKATGAKKVRIKQGLFDDNSETKPMNFKIGMED